MRKVWIPGTPLDTTTLLTDHASNIVVAISYGEHIIVVFFGKDKRPNAKLMTHEQARSFADELSRAHQAFNDDAKIAQLEKEFDENE